MGNAVNVSKQKAVNALENVHLDYALNEKRKTVLTVQKMEINKNLIRMFKMGESQKLHFE